MTSPASYQPPLKLPTEFALAVAGCRWSYSGQGADEVRRLAKSVDWGAFLATSRRQRVQGLTWHALSSLKTSVPAPVRIALAGDARAVADQGLRSARESARLAAAFRDAGLPLLFLKGLTLGKLAYGNPFLKMGWDIDVLVRPEDIIAGGNLLISLGYRLATPLDAARLAKWHGAHNQSLWLHPHGLYVELHSRVTDLPELVPGIAATSPSQTVSIAPGIDLPTLADDELFAYVCVHGGWSAWFRLKWLTDLAALLHGRSAAEIEALYNRSQQLGAGRTAAQALLLAARLYGTNLSDRLAHRLRSTPHRSLANAAMRRMLAPEPTERPLGTLPIHLTHFFLKDGLRYKLAELRRKLRNMASSG